MTRVHGANKSIAVVGGTPQIVLSLRPLLRHTGPIITVRRSIDNLTQSFSFSNDRYGINTNEILDFVQGGDGFVTEWFDQQQNNINVSFLIRNPPKIVSNGILETKNDRPTLRFDSLTSLISRSPITFGSSFGVFQRENIQMVVVQLQGISNYRGLFPGSAPSSFWTHGSYSQNNGPLNSTEPQPLSGVVGDDLFQVSGFGPPIGQIIQNEKIDLGFASSSYMPLVGCVSELVIFPTDVRDKRDYISKNQMDYYGI